MEYNDLFSNIGDNFFQLELNLLNFDLSDINPTLLGICESQPGNSSSGLVYRSCYHLHFIYAGKGFFENAFGKYEVGAGQVFFFSPGEPINYYPDESDPWSYVWIGFETSNSKVLDSLVLSPQNPIFEIPKDIDIQLEFSLIHSMKSGREYYALSLLYKCFSFLNNNNYNNNNNILVHQIANYITNNLSTDLTSENIANHFGYNKQYLGKIFKRAKSQTIQEYILHNKMTVARDYIKNNSNCSLHAIAQMVGYNNYSTFSKVFKKYWGISPKELKSTP